MVNGALTRNGHAFDLDAWLSLRDTTGGETPLVYIELLIGDAQAENHSPHATRRIITRLRASPLARWYTSSPLPPNLCSLPSNALPPSHARATPAGWAAPGR